MEFSAFCAVLAQNAAVELIYLLAACGLVQTVDILSNNGSELALLFKLCKLDVCGIGLGIETEHFCPVEAVELLSLIHKECVAEDSFGRIVPLLAVETVNASEIGYAAFRGDACVAEKYYIIGLADYLGEFFYIVHSSVPHDLNVEFARSRTVKLAEVDILPCAEEELSACDDNGLAGAYI